MPLLLQPKELHPDFQDPSRKPVGAVTVDWSNPLSRGLYDAWLLQANKPKSLVRGQPYSVIGGASVEYKPGSISPNSTDDFIDLATLPVTEWTDGLSFLVVFDNASSPLNNNRYFSVAKNATDDIRILHSTTGPSYNIDWDDGTFTRQNVVTTDTRQPEVILITHTGSLEKVFYKGELAASNADTLNLSGFSGAARLGTSPSATGAGAKADYIAVYAFKRALTDGEGKSLSGNPYQILKPATPLVYFTPDVVAGFSPYWALNANPQVL